MKKLNRKLNWLGVLLLLFLCSSCKNPFTTRKSPAPLSPGGTWQFPASPQIVIQNLYHSYNERIIDNFLLCLADSFKFSSPEDSIDAVNNNQPELFAYWNKDAERAVTANIFNVYRRNPDSLSYNLYLYPDPSRSDDVRDSSAVIFRSYELYIYKFLPAPPETTLAQGWATFYLKITSFNWWSIYFWNDQPKVSGKYDWGDFKASFRY
jgi:hypothetical protein